MRPWLDDGVWIDVMYTAGGNEALELVTVDQHAEEAKQLG